MLCRTANELFWMARRIARFWPYGHTPGPVTVHPEPVNPATPTTLDLRWQPPRT